jgi:ATP-dependent helicase/nuclease subunit A
MTVHGAKGLEADVVFLVDTGGLVVVPGQRDKLVAIGDLLRDPAFLWRRNAQSAPELQVRADAAADEETKREYLRLLYVAMTRARDVLYVAGIKGERTPEECWYSVVQKALVPPETPCDTQTGQLAEAFRWPQSIREPCAPKAEAEAALPEQDEFPDWLFRAAPSPPPAPQPLRPSRALAEPDFTPSPHAGPGVAGGDLALRRGRAVHRLLQLLPGLPAETRSAVAARIVGGEIPGRPELVDEIWREVEAVLNHPELGDFFGPGSRAEVPLVGHVATERGEHAVSGQIDRLLRGSDGWHILDFKTNREVPASLADADPAYVLQLALYRQLLSEMEPGVPIEATLVWTAGPKTMPVPAVAMEKALRQLGVADASIP